MCSCKLESKSERPSCNAVVKFMAKLVHQAKIRASFTERAPPRLANCKGELRAEYVITRHNSHEKPFGDG